MPSHFGTFIPQIMSLLAHDYLITKDPDDITRFNYLLDWMRKHVVMPNPWGEGGSSIGSCHLGSLEPGWEDHVANCRTHGGANMVPMVGDEGLHFFSACCAYARAFFTPRYHAGRRRLELFMPWRLPETKDPEVRLYGLHWPGGRLTYLNTTRRIHVMGEYEGGTLAMRLTTPWYWTNARFTLNGKDRAMELKADPALSLRYVDFETSEPFSLEIRNLPPKETDG